MCETFDFDTRNMIFVENSPMDVVLSHLGSLHPQNWFLPILGFDHKTFFQVRGPRLKWNQFCGCGLPRCESTTFIKLFAEEIMPLVSKSKITQRWRSGKEGCAFCVFFFERPNLVRNQTTVGGGEEVKKNILEEKMEEEKEDIRY